MGDARAVDVALTHEFNGSALQFGLGLQVVAAIGPEQCLVEGDDCGAGLAKETGDPGHLGPVLCHIFAGVWVGAWYDAGGHAVLLHQRT